MELVNQDTKLTTPAWTHYGATATVLSGPDCSFGKILEVSPIPTTGTYYWTSIIQIVWYNTSNQPVAWENFYPTNTSTTTLYGWHGNADMAINTYAEGQGGAGRPWGAVWSYNLNSPTGYIYFSPGPEK